MPHFSTLARSTAKGKVRTMVTGPGPGSRTATSAGFSTPLIDTRTTLPGRCLGAAVVGAAVYRDVPALGVADASVGVALVPHADKTSIIATAATLICAIVPHVLPPVMRVARAELVCLGGVARQRVPTADERVVVVDHRDVAGVDRARYATRVLSFNGADLRTQGIELRLERKSLGDTRVKRGRREVGETERDHLPVAEAVRTAEHGAKAHAGDRVGHEPVLVDSIETGTRLFRCPVPGVVRIRSIAAPDVTELMKRDGDVVFDGPHAELRVGHIDDDVLRVVRGIASMDRRSARRDDEDRDVGRTVVHLQRTEPARRCLPLCRQRRLYLRDGRVAQRDERRINVELLARGRVGRDMDGQ